MITDPRFKFLTEDDVKDIIGTYDLVHIDFKDGEQVLMINTEAEYNRPMFMFEKDYFDNINEAYVTSIIFSLQFRDGSVNYCNHTFSIFNDINNARKNIIEIFNYLQTYLSNDENNPYGYVRIMINDEYISEINLNELNSDELAGYELVTYGITKCRIIKYIK